MHKILFSTTSYKTIDNGPALFANILYSFFQHSNSCDFRILTEDVSSDKLNSKIYKLNLRKTYYNVFLYQFFRIFYYHKEAKKISKFFNYQSIIYNNAFTGYLSSLFLRKKVFVMINDYNRLDFKYHNFDLTKKYFKNLFLFYLEKSAAKKSHGLIVNSDFLKEKIHKVYKIPSSKIKVLKKGVDINKYNYRLRKNYVNEIKILFVKTAYLNGGLFDLIDAISMLKNLNIKLIIIGPYLHELDNIKLKLSEKLITNFEIKGPTAPDKVRNYFELADIFCVPSHKEALGVANMEALACGLPVISTNVGGIPEVLDNGNCGWLVEPESPEKISKAITECVENHDMRIIKSENGYNFVQQFDSSNLVNNFIKIINDVDGKY